MAQAPQNGEQPKMDTNPLTGAPYTAQFYELLERRQKLPAWGAREDFLRLMQNNQVVMLVGGPGSGKTTQLPQILLDAGYHVQNGNIHSLACVQPAGCAAACVAQRVSDELEVQLGTYVGFAARFEDKSSSESLLKFLTDEAFLRELMADPQLERYSVVLLDEVHERTLGCDLLLALLKGVLRRRPELKMVMMAATTNVQPLQSFFNEAPMLTLPGRTHPVDIFYMDQPDKDYLRVAVRTVLQIHTQEPEGGILLFLTTEEEVEHACSQLKREEANELFVVPLYPSLPLAQLRRVFEAPPAPKAPGIRAGRKVVVAAEVGETAIAIDGIIYVVDTGLARQRVYNPRARLESELVAPVSPGAATLRANCAARAGRTGKCYRLYGEKAFQQELLVHNYPEILRSSLGAAVLTLKKLGVDQIARFDFVDPPSPEALMCALEGVHHLGFLDDDGDLTQSGDEAVQFSVDPQVAKMIMEASNYRCTHEVLSIAAMLNVQPVFLRPLAGGSSRAADAAQKRFRHLDGDHLTLLNVFHAFRQQVQDGMDLPKFCGNNFICLRSMRSAEVIREHLRTTYERLGFKTVKSDFQDKEYYPNIRRCLLSGLFMQVARFDKEKSCYFTVRDDQEVALHSSSSLQHRPEWVVYDRFVMTSRLHLRTVTQVRAEWLAEIAPSYYDLRKFPKGKTREELEKIAAAPRRPVEK